MSRSEELPGPAASLALERLRGAWYVLFSDREDWRSRTHPRAEIELLAPVDEHGRAPLQLSLSYRGADLLGRAKARVAIAEALAEPEDPVGVFSVRGHGLVRLTSSRLCVAAVDPDYRWAVLWHSRSTLGQAAGIDVHTRDPWLAQAQVDAIVAAIGEHEFLRSRGAGLFATTQDWFPPEPYRLG